MAPEQIRKQPVDSRTDLFCLGIVLYELLTDSLPFDGADSLAVMEAILHSKPKPPSLLQQQISPDLDAIILKALAKSREDRYATAGDFSVMLARHRSNQERKSRRRRVILAAAILVAVSLIFSLSFVLRTSKNLPYNNSAAPKLNLYPLGLKSGTVNFWFIRLKRTWFREGRKFLA
jgi:serine/threonine protein kinase